MFECQKCGNCCRHLKNHELYSDLDRGDGVCKYLEGNLCSIYDKRSDLCRIDDCYEKYFSDLYTKDEYYKLNYEACRTMLKEE